MSNPSTHPEEWDILSFFYATGEDQERMLQGTHFDYDRQEWMPGHDHFHFHHTTGEVLFCGADIRSCMGCDQRYEVVR